MAAILLKNVPDALRQRLQARAKQNRRSMNQEALVILEQALPEPLDVKSIMAWEPIKLKKPVDWVKAVRDARDDLASRGRYAELDMPAAPSVRDAPASRRRKR